MAGAARMAPARCCSPRAATAAYFVAVAGHGAGADYTVSASILAEDDYASDIDGRGAIGERRGGRRLHERAGWWWETPATGTMEHYLDRDWFAVDLEAGTTYRFELKGSSTISFLSDPPVYRGMTIYAIRGDDGSPIGRRVRVDTLDQLPWMPYSEVFFTPDTTGTNYVEAGTTWGRYQGDYTLSVTEVPADYPADTSTTGEVTVGEPISSHVDHEGDVDWIAVTLDADNKTYRFDLSGLWSSSGTLHDPIIYGIYDGDGNLIDRTSSDFNLQRRAVRRPSPLLPARARQVLRGGWRSSGRLS